MIILKTFIILLTHSLCCWSAISALPSCNTTDILFSDKTQYGLHLFRHFAAFRRVQPRLLSSPSSFFVSFVSALAGTSGASEVLATMLPAQASGVWPLLHQ